MKIRAFMAYSCVIFMASCHQESKEVEAVEKFTVTNPVITDTSYIKEYVSQIKSVKNIEIRTQEKGYLQNIYVDEGQFVKAGQLLFRIMPTLYKAEYDKALAESEMAKIELENAQTLAAKNIVSSNEVRMAQAKFNQAKAEMEIAKAHLSFTEIRAPFEGYIDHIPLRLGSLVEEGELLTNLSDNRSMQVYFNVSEPDYLEYQTNTESRGSSIIQLKLANNQVLPYDGKIELIESEFNNETGNIAFRASFPNPDGILKNGETGKVQMRVPLKNALIIPQKATYELQDKKYVFVVGKDGVIKSTQITVGASLPDIYIVKNGVTSKDIILLDGVQKVNDGDKIEEEFVTPQKALASLRLKAE